jgi:DMSO reductase anchor subunit
VLAAVAFGMTGPGQTVGVSPAARADAAAPGRLAGEVAFTRRQALRTPMFWAVTSAVSATGMIGTGLAFHQIAVPFLRPGWTAIGYGMMIGVAATAFGPVALSRGRDLTCSYVQVLVLLLIPVAVSILGVLAPDPRVVAAEPTG